MGELLSQQLTKLATQNVGMFCFSESLAKHSSWKIGGNADLFIEPETVAQVALIVNFTNRLNIPLVTIGQGTNLLFADAGVRGVVMKIGDQMATITISNNTIVASAGVWVPRLARLAQRSGLTGLEHCIGIPGTIGGLVLMNGGSQRKGIGSNVVGVTVVNKNGQIEQLNRDDCHFSYRQSALQGSGAVVVAVELQCEKGAVAKIRGEMLTDLSTRRNKFPRKQPNCGSVFLSTATMHASVGPPGKIIEEAGLKGIQIGAAEVSQQHANFIVNLGGASAADVLALIAKIRQQVRKRIGFELDCEVRYVTPMGAIVPAHIVADQLQSSCTE